MIDRISLMRSSLAWLRANEFVRGAPQRAHQSAPDGVPGQVHPTALAPVSSGGASSLPLLTLVLPPVRTTEQPSESALPASLHSANNRLSTVLARRAAAEHVERFAGA